MPTIVVVGAQWGDEGKGKIVDLWSRRADMVVRFAGGANAGHTLVVEGEKRVFHLLPSGALHPGARCVIAQGTVVDPEVLVNEVAWLRGQGLLTDGRVLISDRAHLVLPQHKLVDGLRERGNGAIGTTKRGIGPAYQDKAARRGLRIGDLLHAERLTERLAHNLEAWKPVIEAAGEEVPDLGPIRDRYLRLGEALAPHIADTAIHIADAMDKGERILLEGAQGAMLDLDHGTYPFVTSSSAVAGGACAGAGIGPASVDRVMGITKAYTTRVGGGPFPTELSGAEGDRLREAGQEFGATTGRPRRCGWLDLVALRYAVRINGMSELALTKLDVLRGLETLRVCVQYELDGERLDSPPWDGLERVTPIYEDLPGFDEDVRGARRVADLPDSVRRYVDRIEEGAGCRIGWISVGPDRDESIGTADPFQA